MTHLVLGAAGSAGNAIARALAAAGLETVGVTRSGRADVPDGVRMMAADVTDRASLAACMTGVDVVHLAAQPAYHRWPQEWPAMLDAVIGAAGRAGARLVMVDNLYAYGPVAGPMREDTPEAATDPKGRTRAAMTQTLLAAHAAGRVEVVIGRASDYFGPRCDNSAIMVLALSPVTTGRRLRWFGRLDVPHSCAYLPDIARAYVALACSPDAAGRVWHLPHEPAVTGRQFLGMVNAALPEPREIGVLSTAMLRTAAPVHRISRETLAIRHQWTQPFVVDDTDFRTRFPQVGTTRLEEAVARTVAHLIQHRAAA